LEGEVVWDGLGGEVKAVVSVLDVPVVEEEGGGGGSRDDGGEEEGDRDGSAASSAYGDDGTAPGEATREDVEVVECECVSLPWQDCVAPEPGVTAGEFRERFDGMSSRLRHSYENETESGGRVEAGALTVEDHALVTWRGKRLYLRVTTCGSEGTCEIRSDDDLTLRVVAKEKEGREVFLRRFLEGVGGERGTDMLESMEQKEEAGGYAGPLEIKNVFSF